MSWVEKTKPMCASFDDWFERIDFALIDEYIGSLFDSTKAASEDFKKTERKNWSCGEPWLIKFTKNELWTKARRKEWAA